MKQELLHDAADKWVFETNSHKWSNNDDTAGDNYGSFIAGAEWKKEQMCGDKDITHLQWIYDRMSNVHGENENYDYMLKFKEIIEQLKK
jgi:hypothetical protein